MSGWIKWTKGLASRREVVILASILQRDRHEIAGRLMLLWEWCDDNAVETDADESLNVSLNLGDKPFEFLDALLGLPGMAEAMASPGVRWLEARSGGRVVFPKLARHNGTSAKSRVYEALKKRKQRAAPAVVYPEMSPNDRDKTGTREEKRREEGEEKNTADAATARPPPKVEPKENSKRATPTGPHAEAVAAFTERWNRKYAPQTYPFAGGKDGAAVKAMLEALGGEVGRFTAAVDRYLADSDPFYAGHGLRMMQSRLERWLVPAASKRPAGIFKSKAERSDEEFTDYVVGSFPERQQ